jgi:hypothetical protein
MELFKNKLAVIFFCLLSLTTDSKDKEDINSNNLKKIIHNFLRMKEYEIQIGVKKYKNNNIINLPHFVSQDTLDKYTSFYNGDYFAKDKKCLKFVPIYNRNNKYIENYFYFSRGFNEVFDNQYIETDTIYIDQLDQKFKFSNFSSKNLKNNYFFCDTLNLNKISKKGTGTDFMVYFGNLKKLYSSTYGLNQTRSYKTLFKEIKTKDQGIIRSFKILRSNIKKNSFFQDGYKYQFEMYIDEVLPQTDTIRILGEIERANSEKKLIYLTKCIVIDDRFFSDEEIKKREKIGKFQPKFR